MKTVAHAMGVALTGWMKATLRLSIRCGKYSPCSIRRWTVSSAFLAAGRSLEQLLPTELGRWVELAEELRISWKADGVPLADRLRALDT